MGNNEGISAFVGIVLLLMAIVVIAVILNNYVKINKQGAESFLTYVWRVLSSGS